MSKGELTENELIEKFYVSQGGKSHPLEDIYYYESDWNMLMPVVEKIDKMGHDIDLCWHSTMRDGEESRSVVCAIQDRPAFKAITYVEASRMIDATYLAVVDFIKWYNLQPSEK